jgi:hypothetical protein
MRWTLSLLLFVYALLSAAQWRHATRWLFEDRGRTLWCGNVVSDPYRVLVNFATPAAAACAALLALRCIRDRRIPFHGLVALGVFVLAAACLVWEGHFLKHELEFPLGWIWWLPGF